jgi:hypothetical protein
MVHKNNHISSLGVVSDGANRRSGQTAPKENLIKVIFYITIK